MASWMLSDDQPVDLSLAALASRDVESLLGPELPDREQDEEEE